MMQLRIGTRGSRLALIQTGTVAGLLKAKAGIDSVPVVIKTAGDIDQGRPLFGMGGKGIFEKEIDAAVLNGEVDMAVHSTKDLPTSMDGGLVIAAVPERAAANDVLISRGGTMLEDLKEKSVIGTSSLLRIAELRHMRDDLRVKSIRGNVETRIAKLDRGDYDAILLAEAGVRRLGLGGRITQVLPLGDFPPAAGQGALAVVAAEENAEVMMALRELNDRNAMAEVTAERAATGTLGGGCEASVASIARAEGGSLTLSCSVFSVDPKKVLTASLTGAADSAEELGIKAGNDLASRGAGRVMDEWRVREKGAYE